jgi:class 3 adenylate cyclase
VATLRRLAAILEADVVSSSRLMEADEEATHERLKVHLEQFIDPKVREYGGRTVKNTGDGFLSVFWSARDAVRCAIEIQRGVLDREQNVPKQRRILFRIGVNLGDVIIEEEDIFGHDVNVTFRLEGLAEPGGICISNDVYERVRRNLDIAFEDLGEQPVKNIAGPIRVYALRPEVIADLPVPSVPPVPTRRTTSSLPKEFTLQIWGTTIRAYTDDAKFLQTGIPDFKTVPVGFGSSQITKTIKTVPYVFERENKNNKEMPLTDFPHTFANGVRVTFLLFKDVRGNEVFFSVYDHSNPGWIELPFDKKCNLHSDAENKWLGVSLLIWAFISLLTLLLNWLFKMPNVTMIWWAVALILFVPFVTRDWLKKELLRSRMKRLQDRVEFT